MFVYIVNTYQEDGPEDIAATLHVADLPTIINTIFDEYVQGEAQRWDIYAEKMKDSAEWQYPVIVDAALESRKMKMASISADRKNLLANLETLTAAQLISPQSINLQDGWGGLQLHIVKLT